MANVATMGPPPSPKEPRRSGRRPMPSSSKSPAGSPPSEAVPKPKEQASKPSLNHTHSNGRTKRAKNEDIDEPLEELPKNGVNGNGGASRSKRKGKEKEKMALVVTIPQNENQENLELVGDDGVGETGEDEEEGGVTRCICEDEGDQGEFMAQCEECKAWQHGVCMGYAEPDIVPQHYFCEQCRPDQWTELIEQWAVKRARHSSTRSHPPTTPLVANATRDSRSHSPTVLMKAPKRRNTMNSRDAAYEESVQALIEATKSEAGIFDLLPRTPVSAVSVNGSTNGHPHPDHDTESVTNPKKKRKRTDDDAASVKRTRSASITSDRPPLSALPRDPTPQSAPKIPPPPAPTAGAARTANARNKRNASRKSQAQDIASVDGDEAGSGAPNRRQASNNRAKATNGPEHHSRRAQGNAVASGPGGNSAAARAYHNSHAYVVSQQPLFTSWNLPDYLAHLEPMLPTDVPRPLEVRGSVLDGNSRESLERTTERGVKVKWPSKRMSVGDMNKRVRSLVEWVGREQAAAMERMRRKEALDKVLQENRAHDGAAATLADAGADGMDLDGAASENPISREKAAPPFDPAALAPALGATSEDATMKMMEELMEELIRFQERFGPGAKTKERDRRGVTL
ncbi:uncharacterized protein TRAVEDRAFT_34052 [Trametes versicolor FP-101664 SS1]|uniref:uncharacterized protein n=1 Tax=Trametes versicolor (strain FP-101664) TaxID=717944 RepID=UPI0004623C02|nr:uncharacterized protein TRAVEDRAFT_34052 [Trametes versicolor FP-101664 SS1]EIW62668.1 hypothetical protein TRAVEDRAFT_34052 [Trametes versicolor FP-101664 SS1]